MTFNYTLQHIASIVAFFILTLFGCNSVPENSIERIPIVADSTSIIGELDNQLSKTQLISFLENPIDLQDYKSKKGQSLSSVITGMPFYHRPNIRGSIYYSYSSFPTDSAWTDIEPVEIVVLKFGKGKHTWDDKTEILIELNVKGNDKDLMEANLVGLSKKELEARFGKNYMTNENGIVYEYQNKVLIIELEYSVVKSFRYTRLSTNEIDEYLIKEIIKSSR